ncbi:unnamed protein product [Gongylonema pulchrum]|uniref:ADH_N domain-containing protein n=1 Tax=Gongylonema pulchrum TaxID=637853 RepID=A0A183E7K3_9BILA|nr:unnamed protein product [Gongylonema pulchrum]
MQFSCVLGIVQLLNHNVRSYASGKNLCSVLHAAKDLRFEEREIPKPGDDQLLIKMDSVGICGTDIHFFKHFAIGPFKITQPYVLGHEGSGYVVEMGKNLMSSEDTTLSKLSTPGDRVTIEPGVSCRKCERCRTGNYHMCLNQALKGLPPEEGLFRQYATHDADFCYKFIFQSINATFPREMLKDNSRLPENMSMDDGSLLEPLSVGIHGVRKSGAKAGSKVLVLGAGYF